MFCVLEHDRFPGLTNRIRPDTACDLGYSGWGPRHDEWNHKRA
jgi:hypothetical protein